MVTVATRLESAGGIHPLYFGEQPWIRRRNLDCAPIVLQPDTILFALSLSYLVTNTPPCDGVPRHLLSLRVRLRESFLGRRGVVVPEQDEELLERDPPVSVSVPFFDEFLNIRRIFSEQFDEILL